MWNDWLHDAVNLCLECTLHPKDIYDDEINDLEKRFNQYNEENKVKIRTAILNGFDVNDAVFVLSFLAKKTKIEVFKDDIVIAVMKTDKSVWLTCMMELQVMLIARSYKLKRKLHRQNVEKISKCLDKNYVYKNVDERDKKHIVIVTEQILGLNHAPTKFVLEYASVLRKYYDYNVLVVSIPSDVIMPVDLWYEPRVMYRSVKLDKTITPIKHKDALIMIYQLSMSKESMDDYRTLLDLVYNWNPIFILKMGVFNPIADVIGKFTTSVSMGMTIKCPVSDADVLVRIDGSEEEEGIDDNQIQLFMENKFPVIMNENSDVKVTRKELGIPEDKFVIAVVGNRLEKDITTEFIDVLNKIMNINDDMVIAIIGEADSIKQRWSDKKVYFLGYRADLQEVYEVVDLYINPKRTGGGYSGAMAVKKGVPVVTLPDCDVAYHVGKGFVVGDYDEMIDEVGRYINDKEYYLKKKQSIKHHNENERDDEMICFVKEMVGKIIDVCGLE